jgi:hypothetical protein
MCLANHFALDHVYCETHSNRETGHNASPTSCFFFRFAMADSTYRPPGEEFSWYDNADKDKKTMLSATQAKLQHGVSRADLDSVGAVGHQVQNPFYLSSMTVFSMPDIWRAEAAREEREGKADQDAAKRRVEERPARQAKLRASLDEAGVGSSYAIGLDVDADDYCNGYHEGFTRVVRDVTNKWKRMKAVQDALGGVGEAKSCPPERDILFADRSNPGLRAYIEGTSHVMFMPRPLTLTDLALALMHRTPRCF